MYAGLAIYDTMQFIKPDVSTICVGMRHEHGRAPARRRREGQALRAAERAVLIHQPMGGFEGQATDIEIHAKEVISIRTRLDEILAEHTGQPVEKVHQDTDRDYFMTADEAKAYGIIDDVIAHR